MERSGAGPGLAGWLVPALSAAAGAAYLLLRTSFHGPGLDSDGAEYLAAAQSLAEGRGWLGVDGRPYAHWPPLFPALLAALSRLGLGPEDAVRALHALALAADGLLGAALAWRWTGSRAAAGAASAAVVWAALPTAAFAWSEPVFISLALGALVAWLRWCESRSPRDLAVLAATCALALAQRHVGVLLIAPLAVAVASAPGSDALPARVRRCAAFALAACAPLVLWTLRNWLLMESLDARRGAAKSAWSFDARCALAQLVPLSATDALSLGVAAFATACGLLGMFAALRREQRTRLGAIALFPLVFAAGLVLLRQVAEFDELDARLLAPARAVGVLVAVCGAAWCLRTRARWPFAALAATALAVAIPAQLSGLRAELRSAEQQGIGLYDSPHWRSSPTIARLRERPPELECHTNEPHALFLLAGLRCASLPARPGGYAKLYERWSAEPRERQLVWFPFNQRARLPAPPEELGLVLERTEVLDDGELWSVRPRAQ